MTGKGLVVLLTSSLWFASYPAEAQSLPDQWPLFRSCLDHNNPKSCTDSMLQDHFDRHILLSEPDSFMPNHGRVMLEFTIDSLGLLTNTKVLNGQGAMGAEAMRILYLLPKWVPGVYQGRPASITLRLPVTFNDPDPFRAFKIQWGLANSTTISKEKLRALKDEVVHIVTSDGRQFTPTGIRFIYRKGSRVKTMESPPKLHREAADWLDHCSTGGELELVARFAQGTHFEEISRVWTIVAKKDMK